MSPVIEQVRLVYPNAMVCKTSKGYVVYTGHSRKTILGRGVSVEDAWLDCLEFAV